MSGGKGGSQTTQVEVPQYVEDAARANLAQGQEVSRIGYTPYYGPSVAAFSPMQTAAMQNAADFASAFGMAPQMDVTAGMPQAQEYAGGIRGYSSAPLYEQAVAELAARRPAQAALIESQFIDPTATTMQQGLLNRGFNDAGMDYGYDENMDYRYGGYRP
jgi:hypothetical protein